MRTNDVILAGAGLLAILPAAGRASEKQSPNIIVIMADQLRADLMAREGYPLETMPFADELAQKGTWFDRAYTSAPASGPARVSMLTGRFPKATRVRSNHNIGDAFYDKDLFDVARGQGYKTALVGKNHSHLTREKTDLWSEYGHVGKSGTQKSGKEADFDRFLQGTRYYSSLTPAPGGAEEQLPYRIVSDALQWIGSLEGDRFMMWLSFPEPHNPYQVCEPYYSMFPPGALPAMKTSAGDRAAKGSEYELLAEMMGMGHVGFGQNLQRLRSIYHGMMRLIDDQLRRLTESLKAQGVYDNTVILFLADHGDYAGEYGLMKKGAGMDECLVRIPMQWSGPGIVARKEARDAHVSIVDVFPTVCEIIGARIPDGVQGRSLWPMLQGREYPEAEFGSVMAEEGYGGMYYTRRDGTDYRDEGAVHEEPGFFDELNTWTQSGTMRALRRGEWKLVCDMDGNGWLYDLAKDPSQTTNLFDCEQHRGIRMELMEQMLRWEISTEDPLPYPRRRYRFKTNGHNYLFGPEG